MIETFILILFFEAGPAVGSTSVEFYSDEACEAALEKAVEEFSDLFTDVSGICVAKG